MAKEILVHLFFKRFKCFLSFLLIVFLTMSPFYASSDSEGDNAEVTHQITMHMETAGLQDAEIQEKLTQLNDKLSAGMSIEDSCIHCHRKQAGKP